MKTKRAPPRRSDETLVAGSHLPVSFLFLTAATLYLAFEGIAYENVFAAAILAGLGAFTILILGTSRMLIAGIAKRNLPLPRIALLPGLLVTLGTLLLAAAVTHQWPTETPGAFLWSTGVVLHAALVTVALKRQHPESMLPLKRVQNHTPALILAALLLTVLAVVMLPLATLTRIGLLPAIHLVLTGPITLVILVSLLELTPRFTGKSLPRWWGPIVLVTAPLGSILFFAGLHTGPRYLHPGALLLVIALTMAVIAIAHMVKNARRMRPSLLLWGTAGLSLVFGTFLGAGVAYFQLPPTWIPLHGTLNLLGFMGTITFAASIDMYSPALATGRRAALLHAYTINILVILSLIATPVAVALGLPYAAYLLLGYAGAALLHALAAIRRLIPPLNKQSKAKLEPAD